MDPQLVTLIVAIAGSVGTVLAFIAGRRERAANAEFQSAGALEQISQSYMNLSASLEKRIAKLEEDVDELCKDKHKLEVEREELTKEVEMLRAENEGLRQDIKELKEERRWFLERIQELEESLARVENGLTNGGGG